MSSEKLESELRRVLKLFQDATSDFRNRIGTAEPELAEAWERHVHEALAPLERLGSLLAKVYSLPPDQGAKARQEFVDFAAGEFGANWRKHMTELEARVDARYPEPPDPDEPELR